MARVVCETEASLAIYAPAAEQADGQRPLVITFPHLSSHIDGLSFWGDTALAAAGVSAIGLMSKQPQWFVRDEMARLLPALLPIIARHKPARVVTMGFSLGATPALMHGRALGADVSAAFSPHLSIDPAIIGGFDRRPKRTFDPGLHTGFRIEADDLAPLPVLFYDPLFVVDGEHGRRIEALSPCVQRVLVTGTGHFSVTPFMRSPRTGRSLIELLLAASAATVARSARNLARALRNDTPDYHQELSKVLLRHGRAALALRSARRAVELQPNSARRRINLADLHRRLGYPTIPAAPAPTPALVPALVPA